MAGVGVHRRLAGRTPRACQARTDRAGQTVLVMGDSLSAAFGIAASQSWVALNGARMAKTNPGWRVVNASISGETSAGGASRNRCGIEASFTRRSSVIALGANDGLRGLPLAQTKANLDRMIQASKAGERRACSSSACACRRTTARYTTASPPTTPPGEADTTCRWCPSCWNRSCADRANFQDDNLHPVASVQPRSATTCGRPLGPMLK
jgi:acyl-CoA thioesterase-1